MGNAQISPEIAEKMSIIPAFVLGDQNQNIAHFGQSLPQGLSLTPEATALFGSWMGGVPDPLVVAWYMDSMAADLDKLDARFSFCPDDLILVNSIRYHHIAALIAWCVQQAGRKGIDHLPRFAVILHFTLSADGGQVRTADISPIFKSLRDANLQSHFLLYADSEALAREYSDLSLLPVEVVPIPHTNPGSISFHADNVPCIIYTGIGRATRGFPLLPMVVADFRQPAEAGQIRFEFQANLDSQWDVLVSARKALENLPVTVLDGQLSPDQYYALLQRGDIMLLPYWGEYYRVQTSGVLSEAISMAKIPVVPKGTWLAEMVEEYQVGVSFDISNPQNLSKALLEVLQDFDNQRIRACQAAIRWGAINSPGGFLKVLARRMPELIQTATV